MKVPRVAQSHDNLLPTKSPLFPNEGQALFTKFRKVSQSFQGQFNVSENVKEPAYPGFYFKNHDEKIPHLC